MNNAPTEFAGIKTTRHYYEPLGRDDAAVVPVGRRTSEVFLLLVAELPESFKPYAIASRPFVIEDVGALVAELHYADGGPDFAHEDLRRCLYEN